MNAQLPPPVDTPAPSADLETQESHTRQQTTYLIIGGIIFLILAIVGVGIFFLARASLDTTSRIRDIFIILMALESLVIGVVLVILIVQMAILINLLQNEIKPILDSTNETVNNIKGTAIFLSDNLVEPVIKLNSTLAGFKRVIDFIRPNQR
jgi:uncharacterized membrane protein